MIERILGLFVAVTVAEFISFGVFLWVYNWLHPLTWDWRLLIAYSAIMGALTLVFTALVGYGTEKQYEEEEY